VLHHTMAVEVQKDLGRVVFTCMVCDRCLEIRTADGELTVLNRGDQAVAHSGATPGALAEALGHGEVAVEQRRRPVPGRLH
jgi:hypothetical protein